MKRRAELRDLSDDHHTSLVLAQRCKQAARPDGSASPADVWRQVLEAFESHLEPHFQIEERHLLPALEEIGRPELARRIREDHASLRELVGSELPTENVLERFGSLLESHVRFEERQVFEPTQHLLPADALEALADACRSTPRVCPTSLLA